MSCAEAIAASSIVAVPKVARYRFIGLERAFRHPEIRRGLHRPVAEAGDFQRGPVIGPGQAQRKLAGTGSTT